jgi:DNA processing protein
LRDGATVIRDARDVLDAIVGVERGPGASAAQARRDRTAGRHRAAGLEPRLADLLDAVESGRDTVAALAGHPAEAGAIVAGLTELELLGLLRRAAGGRYVRAVPA